MADPTGIRTHRAERDSAATTLEPADELQSQLGNDSERGKVRTRSVSPGWVMASGSTQRS